MLLLRFQHHPRMDVHQQSYTYGVFPAEELSAAVDLGSRAHHGLPSVHGLRYFCRAAPSVISAPSFIAAGLENHLRLAALIFISKLRASVGIVIRRTPCSDDCGRGGLPPTIGAGELISFIPVGTSSKDRVRDRQTCKPSWGPTARHSVNRQQRFARDEDTRQINLTRSSRSSRRSARFFLEERTSTFFCLGGEARSYSFSAADRAYFLGTR